MMVDLVIGQLTGHKLRVTLTVLGIAIGLILVTTLSSLSEGIGSSVTDMMSMISGKIIIMGEGSSFMSMMQSEIDETMLSELNEFSGVNQASGMIIGIVPGIGMVGGMNLDDLEIFDLDIELEDGRWFEEGDSEVVLGIKYAENSGKRVGDELSIRGKKYDVVGILKELGTEDDNMVVGSLEVTQVMLQKEDVVSMIMLTPENVEKTQELADDIAETYDNLVVMSDKDAVSEMEGFTGQLSIMTFAIGSIAAIIAGIGIMNVMFMSVRERKKEIGVMKALGATTNEILGEVLLEAIILSFIGEIIGLLLSVLIVAGINSAELGITAVISTGLIINVTIFAMVLAVISGLLPAREAARLQPAVVLRYE